MRKFRITLLVVMPLTIVSIAYRESWPLKDAIAGSVGMLVGAIVFGYGLEWLVWGGSPPKTREIE